jgi:TM2 domain-containing membrane protein YozV
MKNSYTQKFGIAVTALALFMASCGSNATFSKRYHNRGFNIAWGGGSDAAPAKPVTKKARVEAQESTIAENARIENTVESTTAYAAPLSPVTAANTEVVMNQPVVFAAKATQSAVQGKAIEQKSIEHKTVVKATTKVLKQKKAMADPGDGKSQVIALILCIFVGVLGIHRFYLGYTMEGVLQLLTVGGCGVWALIDLIRIFTGDLKPKNGDYTETL